MKALTLQQPWASLIAVGAKKMETRKWHPKENPGLLAIASSNKKPTRTQREMIAMKPFSTALGGVEARSGVLLAVVTVTGFTRTEEVSDEILDAEKDFGDFTPGRWAWSLGEVFPLERPIHVSGALNLWDLPGHLIGDGTGRPGPLVRALGGKRRFAEILRLGDQARRANDKGEHQ